MIVLLYYSYIVRQSVEICSASGNPYPRYTTVVTYIFSFYDKCFDLSANVQHLINCNIKPTQRKVMTEKIIKITSIVLR